MLKLFKHIRLVAVVSMMLFALSSHAQTVSLTVISNPDGAPAQLKKSELKTIFRGEKERWANGSRIKIALMKPNTPSGKNICKKVFDSNADDFAQYWEQQAFAGKVERPVYFKNAAELQAYVAENSGAIGITDQPMTGTNVQVVAVDGKKNF